MNITRLTDLIRKQNPPWKSEVVGDLKISIRCSGMTQQISNWVGLYNTGCPEKSRIPLLDRASPATETSDFWGALTLKIFRFDENANLEGRTNGIGMMIPDQSQIHLQKMRWIDFSGKILEEGSQSVSWRYALPDTIGIGSVDSLEHVIFYLQAAARVSPQYIRSLLSTAIKSPVSPDHTNFDFLAELIRP